MFKIPAGDQLWEIGSPQVMGILNVTPDSFYEESRYSDLETAVA
jgi:dihydropteroate synthase